jgi:hypothetical protein
MNKGEILHHDGKKFKVQKIASDSIYASLMVSDDKCQRGKPRRLFFTELASSLGITTEAYASKLKSGQPVVALTAKAAMKEQLAQVIVMPAEPVTPEAVESRPSAQATTPSVPAGKNALRDVLETFDATS